MSKQIYKNLHLTTCDPKLNARTCNYWYIVTAGALPHTAFNSRGGLMRWLEERGLSLTKELPAHGVWSSQSINGEYAAEMHMSYDEFYDIPAIIESKTLSNGQYTMARISEENGIRVVHTLNPNCKYRPVYDYAACQIAFN